MMESNAPFQVVSLADAMGILNLKKTAFHKLKATDRNFPKPVILGGKSGFVLRDLEQYIVRNQKGAGTKPNPHPKGSKREG